MKINNIIVIYIYIYIWTKVLIFLKHKGFEPIGGNIELALNNTIIPEINAKTQGKRDPKTKT